ncbi:MAG: hypothetical protein M3Q97_01520 [Bacteroidota bacterium]|nr:hypothetical protein [Bacteroidota bacterium]
MKNITQSWKTSVIALLMATSVIVALIFVWFGKATLSEAGSFLGMAVGLLGSIGFFSSKDSDK